VPVTVFMQFFQRHGRFDSGGQHLPPPFHD
jgi:hypothetical protein